MVYQVVKITMNDQVVWWGYMGRVTWVCVFYVGRCVLREWVVRGGGLDGYFGEQGLPMGIQECLERFHLGCVDYLSRQFVPKCDSPNCEGELATACTASLLVELEYVVT